jgi:hypothetical protein
MLVDFDRVAESPLCFGVWSSRIAQFLKSAQLYATSKWDLVGGNQYKMSKNVT